MVIRLVQNSGKLFPTSTELILLVLTMEILTFSSKELMFTTMKPLEEGTYHVPSLWTLSQVLWTQSELDHSVSYSGQITLSSVKQEQETIGLRDTTPKVLS